jgi:hypothetical protein
VDTDNKTERTRRRNSAAGRVARMRQRRPAGDPELIAAETELATISIEERAREIVEAFPPLREDQIQRIVALLRSGSGSVGT